MKRITAENFEELYVDKIELAEIDKFVCCEMSRQIHRYIKGMASTCDLPSVDIQRSRNILRISVNPILSSKLSG